MNFRSLSAASTAIFAPRSVLARVSHSIIILGAGGLFGLAKYEQGTREFLVSIGLGLVADSPSMIIAGGCLLLTVSLAWEVGRLSTKRIVFGAPKFNWDSHGRRLVDLPIKQTSHEAAECRVKMTIEAFDGSFRREITLQTETRLTSGRASINRIRIDDAFKDFRLFCYNFVDEELTFFDGGSEEIKMVINSFRLHVMVAGAGPRADLDLVIIFSLDEQQHSWLYVSDGINGHGLSVPTYS